MSPYVIRVDRVYKGDIQAGQTVLVNTLNNTWLTPDQLENYNIVSDEPSCYLTVGQKALFCAAFFSCYSPAGSTVDQTGYYIVYDTEGIFEPEAKNSEQIAALDAAEQPDRLLFSESLTIDLDTLEDEIQKAGTDSEK